MRFSDAFLLLLALSCLLLPMVSSEARAVGPREAILRAQSSVGEAYASVVEAEKAGGDVSRLVADLNGALGVLDLARRSYDVGDHDSAIRYAAEAEAKAAAIIDEARVVRDEASRRASNLNVLIAVSLVLCLVVLGVLSHFGLRWIRNRQIRETLKMRVEEGSAE